MFLALAAYLDFEIHQADIVTAYLQGDLNEEIYITISDSISQFSSEDIGNYKKHYMVSNRQDDSGRKDFMKFLQNLALLVYLLMIVYISKRKKAKLFSSY